MDIKKDDIIKCEVSGITNYGVFVKLDNGYDGLIHISEISNKFVNNIEKLFLPGDIIDGKVLEVDNEKKQVKLSIKQIKNKSKRKATIEERGKCFEPLKENLDMWIKEKLEDLEKMPKTP